MSRIQIIPDIEVGSVGEGWKSANFKIWLGLIFFGFGAIFMTLRLFFVEIGGGKDIFAMLICWGFVGVGVFILRSSTSQKGTEYISGKSFQGYRGNDKKIIISYKILLWSGIILTPTLLIMRYWQPGFAALSAIFIGYYGLISKKAHGDIDWVAIEILRGARLITEEKVYASYMNFDPSERKPGKKGDAVFGVLSDSMVILFTDGKGWKALKKKFSQITEVGIFPSSPNGNNIFILIRFMDGDQYKLKLDLFLKLTTEPQTFVRYFLETLDNFLMPADTDKATTRRRRVVEEQSGPSSDASTAPQQASPSARQLELAEGTLKEINNVVVPPKGGRALELEL